MLALDANSDGALSASEIANAPASLRALDANGDGKLTRDELRPLPPVE
jgi:Ca2+-binding EF-hand superfamily protein